MYLCLSVCVGSNWASRQGFTDLTREFLKSRHVSPEGMASTKDVRLSTAEEALAGIIGRYIRLACLFAYICILFYFINLLILFDYMTYSNYLLSCH